MNQDELETLVAQLATQYAEACEEELAALECEVNDQRLVDASEAAVLNAAYNDGEIGGKNAEVRKMQARMALLNDSAHQHRVGVRDADASARKRATAVRVGVEHEWKTWRAWLASQGRNDA